MARRKRASMREGPLADLFRSTVEPDDPPEAPSAPPSQREDERVADEGATEAPSRSEEAPRPEGERAFREAESRPPLEAPAERESSLPDPERVRAYRVEEPEVSVTPPAAKERLSRIFGDEMPDVEGPAFGREEPSYGGDRSPGEPRPHSPVIRVVGVGGAGVNAVNRMVEAQIPGVEFMAINTDLQSLQLCIADVTIHIGDQQTRGLGAGADPEVGHRSAFEEQDKIKRLLKGSDMVFVAAGAGGGTGSGAAPVVARLAREVGALTVGIITRPFSFEGTRRGSQASKGIDTLAAEVDTLITVP